VKRIVVAIVLGLVIAPYWETAQANQAKTSFRLNPINTSDISSNPEPRIISQNPSNQIEQVWQLVKASRQNANSGQPKQAIEQLSQAEKIVRQMANSPAKDQLLARIAIDYATLGQYDAAIAITQVMEYRSYAEEYCCIPFRTEAEIGIAQAYTRQKQYEKATQFAQTIKSDGTRHEVIVAITSELAIQGRFQEAIALTKQITKDEGQKVRAQAAILKGYIYQGQFEQGLALTKAFNVNERVSAQVSLAQAALKAGQFEPAQRIAAQISAVDAKLQVMSDTALAYASVGQPEPALALLNQAYQLAQTQKTEQSSSWASYFAQVGAYDRALKIANSLKPEYDRLSARISIARAYSEAGQFTKALEIAKTVPDGELQPFSDIPDPKVEVIQNIVQRSLQAGKPDLAIQAARSLKSGKSQVRVLRTIAQRYAAQGQTDKALTVLAQAAEVAKAEKSVVVVLDRMTNYSESNARLLLDLARDYVDLKQTDRAIALLDIAAQSAKTFDYTTNSFASGSLSAAPLQVKALTEIALAYAELKRSQPAENLLDEAAKIAKTVDAGSKVEILVDLAMGYARVGRTDTVQQLLAEARQLSPQSTFWLPSRIAEVYAAAGLTQTAAEVATQFLQQPPSPQETQSDARIGRFAIALAAAESPEIALQFVEKVQGQEQKINLLTNIVAKYLDDDRQQQADLVLDKLQQEIGRIANPVQRDIILERSLAINSIPAPKTRAGMSRRYNLQVQLSNLMQNPTAKTTSLAGLALSYANLSELSRSQEVLASALQAAQSIADPDERRQFLLQTFDGMMRSGYYTLAEQIANRLDASYRITALRQIAQQYQTLGQKDRALQLLSQARQTVNEMADATEKQQLLQAIQRQQSRL
jgi:thioredoxin-like negative regulator of GroEL